MEIGNWLSLNWKFSFKTIYEDFDCAVIVAEQKTFLCFRDKESYTGFSKAQLNPFSIKESSIKYFPNITNECREFLLRH